MKVTKAQAAQNRQDILEAAARLYREHGLDGVGVAEVTRGAGLTHGGLYRHFESKDALLREACARAFDWRSEEHTSELQSQSNLVCRLLLEKKKNQRYRGISSSISVSEPWT